MQCCIERKTLQAVCFLSSKKIEIVLLISVCSIRIVVYVLLEFHLQKCLKMGVNK